MPAEHFIKQIETLANIGISKIDAAEKRGHLTAEDLDYLNNIEGSKLPIMLHAYTFAARRDGHDVRSRGFMVPDVRNQKGLYVSNRGDRAAIYVYGVIGFGHGISADDFRVQLAKFSPGETIDMHVHSPGGSFTEAVAIHSQIRNRSGKVRGYVDGKACSAGSLILMPCDTVTMAPAGQMMMHFGSIESEGSWGELDLARALKLMQDTNQKLVELYTPRWKGTEKELRAALEKETYFTAAEAVERGLADYVSESAKIAAYEVVTGTHRAPGFSIAAKEGPHKRFVTRRCGLKLWLLEADMMRSEIGLAD